MEIKNNIEFSVIIPVFNSESTLDELNTRLFCVLAKTTNNFEILYIDDGSTDGSWENLKKIKKTDSRIKIIHLLKNYGQHNAIFCGFRHSSGNFVISMDDDLQTVPEEIPKLIRKISEGYSVVYAKYLIKKHGMVENFFSRRFQGIMHYILNIPDDIFISSFGIFRKEVIDNIKTMKISYIFIPALLQKNTPYNSIGNVLINHEERKYGKSTYTLQKYIENSLNLIIHHSSLPLEIVGIFGFVISFFSFLFGIIIIIQRINNPSFGIIGWNSLMVTITFLGGAILMSLAIIGEYLRRILGELSHEQPYIIGEFEF